VGYDDAVSPRAILLLGLLGCGRIGFSVAGAAVEAGDGGDGAAGHDEDGDGIPDVVDDCPHVSDPEQIDSDGDGVGDVCDPNPTVARDHIAFFDPFVGPRSEWTFLDSAATFADDSLIVDTTGSGQDFLAELPTTAGQDDVYTFGAHILAIEAGAQQHLALGLGENPLFPTQPASGAYYRCEICNGGPCGGAPFYALTYTTDNVSFTHVQDVTAQPFGVLAFTLTFQQAVPTMSCATTFPTAMSSLSGPVPNGITPVFAGFKIIGLEVAVDYFVQIHSD